ncbi:hypothetical protein P872_15750 [Rhodonellum psychrophilum GCM71 = DSM 17998]|uniref:Outer membrane protein beta-barrel domain-containing protein n=2 Tax=Rhodonellum TaxID=336827 RepID=U5BUC8_9BACT|nr:MULTISPECIES: porin family protein [Rhodonellum]ERM84235.1 hypothetical protein P872_15750 [Rhodonellum psychrophilum GCM71 = DSM 17998]SDZ18584.1 Outer membrane protein beta-barrel domain-containing protein [Rhodonellum ikkaensis]
MKKTIILTTTLAIFAIGHTFGQGLHFGAKAGVNFANYTGSDLAGYEFESITNYHAGIFVEFGLFEAFSIQPELLYSTAGSNLKGTGENIKNELGYLSIPVVARFYLIPDRLSVDVGPQVSFLLNEKENVNISNSETFDFALVGGLTYQIIGPLFVQGRYNLGLTDVKKDADVKNSIIQLSAGVRF